LHLSFYSFDKMKIQEDFNKKKQIEFSNSLTFPDDRLKELYKSFNQIFMKNSFKIVGVEHFQFQEVYFIKKGENYLKVQLYYNKKFEPTMLKILETTSKDKTIEFLNIFSLKNQNQKTKNEKEKKEITDENACIKIYIDGSYDYVKKKFGAGLVVLKNEIEKYWKGYYNKEFIKHRNVAGEIYAALLAFEYAKNENLKCVEINYDYEGIEKWALGFWKTNTLLTKLYKEKYDYYSKFFKIKFNKIKSHSGAKFNEIADQLAKKAIIEESSNVKYDINL